MQPGPPAGGGEAELLGAEQRGDDDVAAGLELTVDLHDDPVAQAVEQQGLLGFGQAEFPGAPGVLEGGQRRGPGAAVVPEIRTTSACLGPRRPRPVPTPTFSLTSFTWMRAAGWRS